MKVKRKIISVVGARPQFVKLAPLAKALSTRFRHKIVHTGQHYDANMSNVFFKQLAIPRESSNLQLGGTSHGAMTGQMLIKLETVYQEERPDMVLVYGDTNTTLSAALAAAKLGIPVGHIEAGMRSFVDAMPEEINRRLTDHVSQLLFCATPVAAKNLKREGIRGRIVLNGDLMFELLDQSRKTINGNGKFLRSYALKPDTYLYLTIHRAANVDDKENLERLIEILSGQSWPVLFPIHPRTRSRLLRFNLMKKLTAIENVVAAEPLNYLDNLTAVRYARAVLTDSGGLQKESLFLGTPVLTLRDETEWRETLRMGNRLVGLEPRKVTAALKRLPAVKPVAWRIDGQKPSRIILGEITHFFKGK